MFSRPETHPNAAVDALLGEAGQWAAVWRASQLGQVPQRVWPSGWSALDAVLPGGGWPGHGLTEWLCSPPGAAEWRLLAPLLPTLTAPLALVAPPQVPHPLGWRVAGWSPRHLLWVQASSPAERLWATEQLLRANATGAVVAWLPEVRATQLRRLQVLAAAHEGPVLVCRPAGAAKASSPAPLRLRLRPLPDWGIEVDLVKRKGPPLTQALRLTALPDALAAVLPARLRPGARPLPSGADHVVVRPVVSLVAH